MTQPDAPISVLTFLDNLNWIDGAPLQVEPYRRDIFRKALDACRYDGLPQYTLVLAGRAKKNFKSADLILAGLFCMMCRESPQGSDVLLIGNDEDQATADLDLAKKIVGINPVLAGELEILSREIRRRDGKGTMRVLPAQNAIGQHGRTAVFVGFDEIHGYRNWDLLEALQPDPTRHSLTWITSYDSIYDVEGCPLHDLKKIGMAGTDPGMLFSWYSADFCTDPAFAQLPPDQRANPSMASWPEGPAYIAQQRRRLPSARFRRLHHNLPGAPQGAFYDQATVERAIVAGRSALEPQEGVDYLAFVDMSGGSSDDATLAIAHWDGTRSILDLVISQGEAPPFNPRVAISTRFVVACRRFRCSTVHGDAYAGETFRRDFSDASIDYVVCKKTRTDLYEDLEVALNADQVEMLDVAKLRQQLLTLIRRGAVIDHQSGQHDDWATSAAGALALVNPDIGNPTPAMLEFYRRQSAALTKVEAPTVAEHHAFDLASRRNAPIADAVRVVWPGSQAPSRLEIGGTGYLPRAEGTAFVFYLARDDARVLLKGQFPRADVIAANQEVAAGLEPLPREPAGITVTDALDAMRPQSIAEFAMQAQALRVREAERTIRQLRGYRR